MKAIFLTLKNLFSKPQKGTGALIDSRREEEKIKDYKFEETVTAITPVNWIEKSEAEWKKYPIFDQNGSGSCVAQTLAKMLGILYWLKNKSYVHFSATHIYQRRKNKPSAGMAGVDAFEIARNGVTLEQLVPSQNMTDVQMDTATVENYKADVGEIFRIGNYVDLPIKNIDTIASTIQVTEKPVMVWFYFKHSEWVDVPFIEDPNLPMSGEGIGRHSVTAIDYTLYDGKKALIIEDSWGPKHGKGGRRIITEDFFKVRNFFAAYAINFKFEDETSPTPIPVINKPKHKFLINLEFSSTFKVDPEVKYLQEILKYEGLFPNNIDSTGYYGSITSKAVIKFQKKYKVASDIEIDQLAGRIVGPNTRKKLNELYS